MEAEGDAMDEDDDEDDLDYAGKELLPNMDDSDMGSASGGEGAAGSEAEDSASDEEVVSKPTLQDSDGDDDESTLAKRQKTSADDCSPTQVVGPPALPVGAAFQQNNLLREESFGFTQMFDATQQAVRMAQSHHD